MKARGFAGSTMVVLAGMVAVIAPPLTGNAFEFVVRTTSDTNDGLCTPESNPIQMTCSLREAIIKSNEYLGADTIEVPSGTYHLTILGANEGQAATGDLNVRDHVEIRGAGSGETRIVGDLSDNVFQVGGGSSSDPQTPLLQFFDLTISGGKRAIFAVHADVYLWRSTVEDCGDLTVLGTAILSQAGVVLLADSVVRRNLGMTVMELITGTLLIFRSTISDNSVQGSAAIFCDLGTAGLVNTTIAGNRYLGTHGRPGGFVGNGCSATIDSCTVAGNTPYEIGLNESFPSSTIRNTYVHGDCTGSSYGHSTSEGGNVGGNTYCNFDHATDIAVVGDDSLVMPLGNHGGYTPTMPPIGLGNVLVDNPGADANCQTVDQRGVSRPQDGGDGGVACDTGAFERTPSDYVFYWGDGFETGDTNNWDITEPPP